MKTEDLEWEKEERCIWMGDAEYPKKLAEICHAPKKLYVRGTLPDPDLPSAAIIGARECSIYGREMARWFGEELARAGVQIISGMARGVDGTAQMAALRAGGDSFGVLGCGTDICYPKENRKLYEMLCRQGGVLSEHPQGTPPISRHFPSRNRLISALSDCVLVIEARKKSGSLITADFALEQGREVYVLPGRLTDALSGGCNALLCQGAGLALSPDHILEFFRNSGRYKGWTGRAGAQKKKEKTEREKHFPEAENLDKNEKLVLAQLDERPAGLQEIFERIKATKEGENMELPQVTKILMELAMRKIILPERGNKYRRKTKK